MAKIKTLLAAGGGAARQRSEIVTLAASALKRRGRGVTGQNGQPTVYYRPSINVWREGV